jgi:hypothetical protein
MSPKDERKSESLFLVCTPGAPVSAALAGASPEAGRIIAEIVFPDFTGFAPGAFGLNALTVQAWDSGSGLPYHRMRIEAKSITLDNSERDRIVAGRAAGPANERAMRERLEAEDRARPKLHGPITRAAPDGGPESLTSAEIGRGRKGGPAFGTGSLDDD